MTITASRIRTWNLTTLTIGGVDFGALGPDAVRWITSGEIREITAANILVVIKRLIIGWSSRIEFTALEWTRQKLNWILQKTVDTSPFTIGTEPVLQSRTCVMAITLSDGNTLSVSGNIEFAPELDLGMTVREEAAPATVANFIPNPGVSNVLATVTMGSF